MKYCTTTTLVKPTVTICSKGIQHNLVCIFGAIFYFLCFLEVLNIFWEFYLNRKEKENKSRCWAGILAQGLAAFMTGSPWRLLGRTVEEGDTSAHPAAGGGLVAQELTGGLCGERWMAQVRRECEGRVKQGEVCHGSPRRSGVDDAAESGMDGGVLATVDGSRGLAVIQHCPCRAVRGRGR
jgi:hypothetical protein